MIVIDSFDRISITYSPDRFWHDAQYRCDVVMTDIANRGWHYAHYIDINAPEKSRNAVYNLIGKNVERQVTVMENPTYQQRAAYAVERWLEEFTK